MRCDQTRWGAYRLGLAIWPKQARTDTHRKPRCGLLLKLGSLPSSTVSPRTLIPLNNPHISSSHRTRPPNYGTLEAIRRCNLPYSIRACREWHRAIQHKAEGFIRTKAPSSSCKRPPPALSQALRAGCRNHNPDLEACGAGQDNPSDDI